MKVALYTPLPRLAGDLCDVLRLFWPVFLGASALSALLIAGCRVFFRTEDYL